MVETEKSGVETQQRYSPAEIEPKWQARWDADAALYAAEGHDSDKPKYYVLEMLPYPSGALHMGHVRNYAIGDALARYMWMRGYNVLHPMGWDAFGLPAENAALKNNTPPREWTLNNISAMKKQFQRLGMGFDWASEITTCFPEYYRWNQWFFLKMYEMGLAYRKKSKVNWCPECRTVLANEQVVNGCCWRHEETIVEQRDLTQWFLRITKYADELLAGLDKLDGWPEKVKTMQRNWIGRSEGAEVDFAIQAKEEAGPSTSLRSAQDDTPSVISGLTSQDDTSSVISGLTTQDDTPPVISGSTTQDDTSSVISGSTTQDDAPSHITVFTTRVDTIFGVTSVQLAPEHTVTKAFAREDPSLAKQVEELLAQQAEARAAGDIGTIEKHGVLTGRSAVNPFNGELVPIWVANYILADYGTGAIMSVPAHDVRDFEFATKYRLPVKRVIAPDVVTNDLELPYTGEEEAVLIDSGEWSGESCLEAQEKMAAFAKANGFGTATVTYRLKDWGVSRQRYWGTPIPMVYCTHGHEGIEAGGLVALRESDLPVILPPQVEITQQGGSPLGRVPDFVNTTCPVCGGPALRETDTMDTFVDSSWYFYRYTDAHNSAAPFTSEKANYWFPIDQYIGGVEHAILHLIYSRFWTKVMRDMGLIANDEPATRLFTQGMVVRNGSKMSKSRGNVVSPDLMIERYGADATRMYALFAAPPDRDLEWQEDGVAGISRFLSRVYRLVTKYAAVHVGGSRAGNSALPNTAAVSDAQARLLRKLHQTIAKITQDFSGRWHFNTSIAAIMELVNDIVAAEVALDAGEVSKAATAEIFGSLVLMLSPFAPFFAAELWEQTGGEGVVFRTAWPAANEELARENEIEIPVQTNGKLVCVMKVTAGSDEAAIKAAALSNAKVVARIEGKTVVKVIVVPGKLVNLVVK